MNTIVTNLFSQYRELTGSVDAAAALVLADVTLGKQPTANLDTLNPPQVAKLLGVDAATVIAWIRSRQLKASNVGKGGQRPRFRIQQSDLDAFLKARQIQPAVQRQRRSKPCSGEIEFF